MYSPIHASMPASWPNAEELATAQTTDEVLDAIKKDLTAMSRIVKEHLPDYYFQQILYLKEGVEWTLGLMQHGVLPVPRVAKAVAASFDEPSKSMVDEQHSVANADDGAQVNASYTTDHLRLKELSPTERSDSFIHNRPSTPQPPLPVNSFDDLYDASPRNRKIGNVTSNAPPLLNPTVTSPKEQKKKQEPVVEIVYCPVDPSPSNTTVSAPGFAIESSKNGSLASVRLAQDQFAASSGTVDKGLPKNTSTEGLSMSGNFINTRRNVKDAKKVESGAGDTTLGVQCHDGGSKEDPELAARKGLSADDSIIISSDEEDMSADEEIGDNAEHWNDDGVEYFQQGAELEDHNDLESDDHHEKDIAAKLDTSIITSMKPNRQTIGAERLPEGPSTDIPTSEKIQRPLSTGFALVDLLQDMIDQANETVVSPAVQDGSHAYRSGLAAEAEVAKWSDKHRDPSSKREFAAQYPPSGRGISSTSSGSGKRPASPTTAGPPPRPLKKHSIFPGSGDKKIIRLVYDFEHEDVREQHGRQTSTLEIDETRLRKQSKSLNQLLMEKTAGRGNFDPEDAICFDPQISLKKKPSKQCTIYVVPFVEYCAKNGDRDAKALGELSPPVQRAAFLPWLSWLQDGSVQCLGSEPWQKDRALMMASVLGASPEYIKALREHAV